MILSLAVAPVLSRSQWEWLLASRQALVKLKMMQAL
jgi:hypothetical protein